MYDDNCIFCKIAAGTIPATIVYQDDDVVAFADINPAAPHHILFIPRNHIPSMADLKPEDGPLLTKIHMAAIQVARDRGLNEHGYRFVSNIGPDGGQTVFHLHFHLLGGRKFSWPPG